MTLQGFQEVISALKQAFYLCQLSVGDSTLPPFCVFRPGETFLQHGESRQGKDDHIFVLPAVEGNRVGLSRHEILGGFYLFIFFCKSLVFVLELHRCIFLWLSTVTEICSLSQSQYKSLHLVAAFPGMHSFNISNGFVVTYFPVLNPLLFEIPRSYLFSRMNIERVFGTISTAETNYSWIVASEEGKETQ